ncbi:MAG TPA: hypothetical protein VMB72_09780 [Acidimicrobiales bacterium]|nr:hypothetical protein [Acidimicrobiales bacterium]
MGAALAAGGTLGLAVALSGCASANGTALALQACTHVDRSLALYRSSLRQSDPAVAGAEQERAIVELRDALPTAATAAGEDGEYQALMSTLAESDHLPESLLVHALSAQCAAAQSGGDTGATGTTGGTGPGATAPGGGAPTTGAGST